MIEHILIGFAISEAIVFVGLLVFYTTTAKGCINETSRLY
jgi:hypothetical protein